MWFQLAILSLALADPSTASERARSGSLAQRLAEPDDAQLVVFYTSEQAGKLGTCGCAHRPRGGLARLHSYVAAHTRAQPATPSVLVHAGRWASDRIDETGALRPDARIANQAMLDGLSLAGADAANISWRDAPSFSHLELPAWATSATLGPADIPPVHRVQAGDIRIAIVGASPWRAEWLQPGGWTGGDLVPSVQAAVDSVADSVDLVVVLAFETAGDTARLAEIPGVHVVVEAGEFVGKDAPWTDEDTVWVRSRSEGQSVGELRLWLDEEGRITRAVDRWVDLDDRIPEHGAQRRLARRADRAQSAWLREALGTR